MSSEAMVSHDSAGVERGQGVSGTTHATGIVRRRLKVRGRVQGVGFRPFVWRLARDMRLAGFLAKITNGAFVESVG